MDMAENSGKVHSFKLQEEPTNRKALAPYDINYSPHQNNPLSTVKFARPSIQICKKTRIVEILYAQDLCLATSTSFTNQD